MTDKKIKEKQSIDEFKEEFRLEIKERLKKISISPLNDQLKQIPMRTAFHVGI